MRDHQAALLDLGRRIALLRARRRLSQEALAESVGLSVSFVSLLERGERSPSFETVLVISEALQVSLALLVGGGADHGTGPSGPSVPGGRLKDFAQRARLTDGQIDRLIAVASAMFELDPQPATQHRCALQGCGRPVLAKGLCSAHYHRERRRHAASRSSDSRAGATTALEPAR